MRGERPVNRFVCVLVCVFVQRQNKIDEAVVFGGIMASLCHGNSVMGRRFKPGRNGSQMCVWPRSTGVPRLSSHTLCFQIHYCSVQNDWKPR